MNSPHPADPHIAALRRAQAAHPRFASTSCSQCGTDTGPGDSGFSHCADHAARDAILRTAGQAIDASRRPAFEAINGKPAKPSARPSFTAHDLRDQITEALSLLAQADHVVCGLFGPVDIENARRLMDDAADALAEG